MSDKTLSDKTFNFIRFLAEIGITALGTFYKVVAEIWGLGYGEAVLATCVALSTLIGVFVEYKRSQWNKAVAANLDKAIANAVAENPDKVVDFNVNREDIE